MSEVDDFRDFVTARWHALLRTAYLLTGDHHLAEDLVQSALVRTHRRWAKVERREAAEAYVRRTMFHLQCSLWRRRRVGEHLVWATPEGVTPDAVAAYDLRDELWRRLLALPPRMRAVLVLRYFEDLPEAEIAQTLECAVGTVKSQLSRGLTRLRDAYDGQPEVTARCMASRLTATSQVTEERA